MDAKHKIITDGVLDGLTWLIICGAVLLAAATQALKALGVKPPISAREILVRSLGAGLAALTLGLILLGLNVIELHWALVLGGGGIVGYWGQEALAFAVEALKIVVNGKIGGGDGKAAPEPPTPPSQPGDPSDPQGGVPQ